MNALRPVGVLLSLALFAACGSKTGIDPSPSETVVPSDGGSSFDTFPCRWSYTLPVQIGRSPVGFGELLGAVHGQKDELVALTRPASSDVWVGASIARDPPEILSSIVLREGGELGGYEEGYAQLSTNCIHRVFDDSFSLRDELPVSAGVAQCVLGKGHDRFHVTRWGPFGIELVSRVFDGVVGEQRSALLSDSVECESPVCARAVRVGTGAAARPVAAALVGGLLRLHDVERGGVLDLPTGTVRFDLMADPLRPGLVLLRQLLDGRFLLERVPLGDDLGAPSRLARLEGLPVAPTGTLLANETEALLPLRDGQLAIAPLSGSGLRILEAPAPEVRDARLLMRQGSSTGAMLYNRVEAGQDVLEVRWLVCNR